MVFGSGRADLRCLLACSSVRCRPFPLLLPPHAISPANSRPIMSRGFFRSTAIVGLTTLLSRITGLMRDVVYASMVPAIALEAFVLANQIPNLLRRLFAEGAFSQAFVPVVAEYRA